MRRESQDSVPSAANHSRRTFRSGAIVDVHFVALLCLTLVSVTHPLGAQIRGSSARRPGNGVFLSGGVGMLSLSTINDGATQSRWLFSTSPQWQYRGTIEKGIDPVTTIGVAASFGRADMLVGRFTAVAGSTPPAATLPLPDSCRPTCAARAEVWSLMGQFRSGGGSGFYTSFEAMGGVLGVRNIRTRDTTASLIGKASGSVDLSGAAGIGVAYGFSRHFAVTLVQDFGFLVHAKSNLPANASRFATTRQTRLAFRIGVGN